MCVTFFCLYPYAQVRKINRVLEQDLQQSQKSETKLPCLSTNDHLQDKKMQKIQQKEDQLQYSKDDKQEGQKQVIKFIIAFNRDEQTERKTLKMGPFEGDPYIYAGRDAKSTGTWLGINVKTGIMVVLTNYDLPQFRAGKSRGQLVQSFLSTASIPSQFHNSPKQIDKLIRQKLIEVLKESEKYPAYNLLVFNMKSDCLFYICSELGMKEPALLSQHTVYGLCNTDLNTIWPKTKHGCHLFQNILKKYEGKNQNQLIDSLSTLMRDNKKFSTDLNDEASIFIQPFYSTLQNAERMTKSTFIAIIKSYKQNQQFRTSINMKQITHKNMQEVVERGGKSTQKYESKKCLEGYDHTTETVVEFELNL